MSDMIKTHVGNYIKVKLKSLNNNKLIAACL